MRDSVVCGLVCRVHFALVVIAEYMCCSVPLFVVCLFRTITNIDWSTDSSAVQCNVAERERVVIYAETAETVRYVWDMQFVLCVWLEDGRDTLF